MLNITTFLDANSKRLDKDVLYNPTTGNKYNSNEILSIVSQIGRELKNLGIDGIDGALIDLGVSSYQLDTAERGFSYMQDAPLDMRMDRQQTLTAYDVVNGYSEAELKKILFTYGEEKFAKRIATFIVNVVPAFLPSILDKSRFVSLLELTSIYVKPSNLDIETLDNSLPAKDK